MKTHHKVELAHVVALADAGADHATPLEHTLRNAYYRTLNTLVRDAAHRFSRHAVTASAAGWHLPDRDEVLPEAEARDQLVAATQGVRVTMLRRMMGEAMALVGVSFATSNPLVTHALDNLGYRITEITELTRTEIMRSLVDSHAKGLSIPHAARAMSKDVRATNISRSTLIARTEFIGAKNASSLAAVQITDAAQMKIWLATGDERTRETHAEADGQTVPIRVSFDVGGEAMMYPGDQAASADEVCNCRCTMVYS